MNWLLLLAALTTLGLLAAFVDFVTGHRRLGSLRDLPPGPTGPAVSVIVAARNEARGIKTAVTSLLRLDYPALDIIIVNDRSTDDTGAILERIAGEHPRLKVTHISKLPEGWLGKNYALCVGAERASGTFLLFTDGDVVFEPTTLRRAVTLMGSDRLDHLTAIPDVKVPGLALNAFIAAFGVFFLLYSRPWKAHDPRSRAHIGVGAFNLIRRNVYRTIGTHRAIAMRPDDDMKLGELVKKQGFCQDVVSGRGLIFVEWYSSVRELIDGLMKNSFASVDYSLLKVVGSTAAMFLTSIWPFLALFVTHGVTRALNAVSVLLIVLIYRTSARHGGTPLANVMAFPAAALLFIYIIWRSALLAVTTGTVTWRGTAYRLAEMRANRV